MRQGWFWTTWQHRGSNPALASSQAVIWAEALHKPAGCCKHQLLRQAEAAPLPSSLLTAFHFAQNDYVGFGRKVAVTRLSAGSSAHLEGRQRALAPANAEFLSICFTRLYERKGWGNPVLKAVWLLLGPARRTGGRRRSKPDSLTHQAILPIRRVS